ncbi:MAG: putative rane protein [Phycisphaerales bacterium]|nr:putative rane protein [Phycisphaerales bacterium]
MKEIALLALLAWVPFTLLLFAVLPPRRAVIAAYVGGWLFLPMSAIKLAGLPDLTKITASSFGILLAVGLFDWRLLLKFRPAWYDLPMLGWCLSPFATSVVNGLGVYDGASSVVQQLGLWGIPYLVGRLYFRDLEAFKELGVGIVVGAIVYLPFCYVEMVISPTLHQKLYGFVQHSLAQSKRWGGFRPMVFMQSGLALAMYMTTASLLAGWMWVGGSVRRLGFVPMSVVTAVLCFTQVVVCKTVAASGFMVIGLAALFWIRSLKSAGGLVAGLPILVLAAIAPTYMYLRGSATLDRDKLIDAFSRVTTEERLQSLSTRMVAEDMVVVRAFDAPDPKWGWGKWDPNDLAKTPWRVYSEYMKPSLDGLEERVLRDSAPTDGLWIITLGQYGTVGLSLLALTITLPAFILWRRIPLRFWHHPAVAPVAAMSVLLLLHMVDNLLNAMLNPLFMLALGGISGIGPAVRSVNRRYGVAAATAVLDQGRSPTAGAYPAGVATPGRGGYIAQPVGGYATAGYASGGYAAGGYGVPQFTTPAAGFSGVPGFPSIAGLQAAAPPVQPAGRRGR